MGSVNLMPQMYTRLEGFALYGFCKSHAFLLQILPINLLILDVIFSAYYYATFTQ